MRRRLIRILVVDDERSTRILHAHLLTQMGYQVTTASNGCEALRKLEQQVADAIVSDLEMPLLDGFDLAREVARRPGCTRPRLLAITANDEGQVEGEAAEAGYDTVLFKPIAWHQLEEAMACLEKLALSLD